MKKRDMANGSYDERNQSASCISEKHENDILWRLKRNISSNSAAASKA